MNAQANTADLPRIPLTHSLVARSMAAIALLLALIAALSVYLNQTDIKSKALQELRESSEKYMGAAAQGIAPAVRGMNLRGMEEYLAAIKAESGRNFCGVAVKDPDGEVMGSLDFPESFAPDELTLTQSVRAGDEYLGTLTLCTRVTVFAEKINDMIIRELIRFGTLMVIILAAVYWAMQILVRPVLGVCEAMGNVARTMKPIDNPDLLKQNEAGILARGFNRMVADLSETYNALDAARQRAIKSESDKTDFLSNMSHDLRSPLNNVIGSVQLLRERKMDPKDKELFSIIEKSSQSLLTIVNDILDLSKIEAGQVRLEHIPFDAYEKVRDVSQAFIPQASKKGVVVKCETEGGDSLRVVGDPMRFERILTNITGNALRYTDKGSITLRARTENAGNGMLRLRCEVVDTGVGIPKDRQDKIFNRYGQAEDSTARRFGGTGLGLTITKELVQLMNGKIGLESEVGKGTTFWFEVLFAEAGEAEDDGIAQAALAIQKVLTGKAVAAAEARVLVAEDHEINRSFIRRLFENLGIVHFTFAESGRVAVEEVLKGKFDVVLMDCNMPEMDGYTATAAIRNLPDAFQRNVPIIAMTANAMEGERERCIAAGMSEYVSKPFEIEKFRQVLSPWIDFEGAAPVAPAPDEKKADDTPANLEILASAAKGDAKFMAEMVELFITTADESITELEKLAPARDSHKEWTQTAHGLKGVAGIVGATRLQSLALAAEKIDDDKAKKKEAVTELREEYGKLVGYLKENVVA